MTLLLISDVHGYFEVLNEQLRDARERLGRRVEAALVVGDLGLFEGELRRFFDKKQRYFDSHVYFIDGNHEDHGALPKLCQRYGEQLTHLPRGTLRRLRGHRFLALGGAAYMDAATTPRRSVIAEEDIDLALSHDPRDVDIVLTHDCPQGIGVRNSPGFEHYGPPGFERGLELQRRYRPRLWVFGHHHRWHRHEVDGTHFQGLAESWRGYALLADDGTFEVVEHQVSRPRRRGWLQRIFGIAG